MKKFAFYHPFVFSFFSKDLYRGVAKNWRGIGGLYLLFLITLSSIPAMWAMKNYFDFYLTEKAPAIIRQIPEMEIKNGELILDKSMPYIINNPGTDEPLIIIDTTESITSLDNTTAILLLTKHKMFARDHQHQEKVKEFSFTQMPDSHINKEKMHQYLIGMGKWFLLFLYPMVILATFLVRLLQAIVYGLIGMIFNKRMKTNLSYQQVLRLTMIALTPAIVVTTILKLFSFNIPFEFVIYFLMTMSYLYFGIKSNQEGL